MRTCLETDLLEIHLSLHVLGIGISFSFLKAKSRKMSSVPLPKCMVKPHPNRRESRVLPCKHVRAALQHNITEKRNGEKGRDSARGGWELRRYVLFFLTH